MAASNDKKSFSQRITMGMGRFASARYVKVISAGMMGIMPISLAGSLFMIITTLDFMPQPVKDFCTLGSTVTLNLITIYTLISLTVAMANECKQEVLPSISISFACFLAVTPIEKMFAEAVEGAKTANVISISYLGSRGMFVGIIVALVATRAYSYFIDNNIYIRMPAAVPKGVSKIFQAIVPAFCILFFFLIVDRIIKMTPFENMHDLIYKILQIPLQNLGGSIVSACILYAVSEFLWFFGIHGSNVSNVFLNALFATQAYENAEAVLAGDMPRHVINMFFLESFKGPRALAIAILLVWYCRSQHMKSIGKVAIIPSVFGITEPMKFGIPMVLNVWLIIPMTLAPVISILIAYAATLVGFLPIVSANVSRQLPPLLQGFLVAGWQGALIQLIQLFAIIALYIPFIYRVDKEAKDKENVAQ